MHNRIKLHAFFFGKNNERKGKSMIVQLIENIYQFLWGEWIHVPLPGGGSLGLSLLIIQQVSFLRSKQNFYQSVCSRIWSKH